jgi:hypothetical protein
VKVSPRSLDVQPFGGTPVTYRSAVASGARLAGITKQERSCNEERNVPSRVSAADMHQNRN